MLNYSIYLADKQNEFIDKFKKRYIRAHKLKIKLFDFWDSFPYRVDGRVIKSDEFYEKMKKNVFDCGNFLEFKAGIGNDKIRLDRANFCKKDKLCLTCSIGRAYNQQKKFFQALEVYPYENDDDLLSKHWYYIVTPVRHSPDESLEIVFNRSDALRKSALMQMRDGRRGKSDGFWSQFNGGMGSIEFTFTRNGWNVHINWLVNSDDRVQLYEVEDKRGKKWYQNELLERFLKRFNDSYIHSISELNFDNREQIRENLLEVLKYSLKFSSLEPHQLVMLYYFLYRKRLFFTFGNLRGLDLESVSEVSIGDEFEEGEEFIRLIYRRLPDLKYKLDFVDVL